MNAASRSGRRAISGSRLILRLNTPLRLVLGRRARADLSMCPQAIAMASVASCRLLRSLLAGGVALLDRDRQLGQPQLEFSFRRLQCRHGLCAGRRSEVYLLAHRCRTTVRSRSASSTGIDDIGLDHDRLLLMRLILLGPYLSEALVYRWFSPMIGHRPPPPVGKGRE